MVSKVWSFHIRKLIAAVSLVSCISIGATEHALTNQIKKNAPHLSTAKVEVLQDAITRASVKVGVDPSVLSAIFSIESNYELTSVNVRSHDYGIGQVNVYNIRAYKLDIYRLLYDMDYSMYWSAVILKWFVDRYPLYEAVQRYNCGLRKRCVTWKGPVRYLHKFKEAL